MREIHVSYVKEAIARLCISSNYELPTDVLEALKKAVELEEAPLGKEILNKLIENAQIAASEGFPICQDTGLVIVFIELGQEVRLVGGDFYEAIQAGVRQGYQKGYLRKSIVNDPFIRLNTDDNTPAIVYLTVVPGDKLKISLMTKGGGAENMSRLAMFAPSEGIEGVKRFVVDTVKKAGANPCPPIIIGVGIGGNFEYSAYLAKKALLRKIGDHNPQPEVAKLETELLELVNKTGIGPQGLGGKVTALAVNIETAPCHLASLPVAVNIQCHAARHKEIII